MLPFNRPALIVVLALVAAIFGLRQWGSSQPEEIRKSRILMDTVVEITVFGSASIPLQESVDAAFKEIERIEALTSFFQEKSDLSRLKGAGSMEVSPETAAIIATGLEVAAASGGAFDMTLGKLKDVWQIEGDHPHLPQPEEIKEALAGSGPGALVLEGGRVVRSSPETSIDLGGIAKGYAIDRAIEVLKKAGVEHAAVNAGGDIRLLGDRRGQPWRIAIQHPRQQNGFLGRLLIQGVAVVTSGDYERFFEKDGIRYHHLFDPRTGYPATASQSVTVLADTAVVADALATAAFVLGPQEGIALLKKFPGSEGMIVGADGKPAYTPGFGKLIEWQSN